MQKKLLMLHQTRNSDFENQKLNNIIICMHFKITTTSNILN